MDTLGTTVVSSPLGPLHLVTHGPGLCGLVFDDHWDAHQARLRQQGFVLGPGADARLIVRLLDAYFRGRISAIDEIPVALVQGSPFQRQVWLALRRIPAGKTWSYGQLAQALGHPPGASRAVGAANGANPVSIVLPCHRVIGSTGALVGYGGGLPRKRALLVHEGALLA